MDVRRGRVSTSVRTEGGLLPADFLGRITESGKDVPGLTERDYGLEMGMRFGEAITQSWNRLVGAWAALTAARAKGTAEDPLTTPTRAIWLLPLFEELGFGRLATARPVEIEGTSYPVSHAWKHVPIHLVGINVELDHRTPGVRGAAGAAPHALLQDLLNRSEERLWGVVSNGRLLRLLRDSTSLTRQAFVEFDLEAILDGELYADFVLLWLVCHRSRFEAPKPEEMYLERWFKQAAGEAVPALERLRDGVERAIERLGSSFLAHSSNVQLRDALRSGSLDRQDYYRELLRLVYRLIFLFTAEDRRDEATGRELLLDPSAPEEATDHYRRFYSTTRLRTLASRRRGTRHGDLWVMLRRVVGALGGDGSPSLALPALGSFLFSSEACPHLDAADLSNDDLLDAVRALATIEDDRRLRPVDYRNLGAEELGSVYEGLLELHPRIEMDANPPRFSLSAAAGNERKTTGSYYTPTSLINCLLDSALDPVLNEAATSADPERAILSLSVVDPAAGSGHFLVAAAHRIAKRLAAIRSGEGEPPPTAVRHELRDVITHCIYAVDINPMAVELCKVSLWLEALEPGRPLSFLDAHIKCGNSLLGTTPELVAQGIPDAAYEPITGDDKAVARAWRAHNAAERSGQRTLFGSAVELPIDALAAAQRELEELPEADALQVRAKGLRYRALGESAEYQCAALTANTWCAAFVAPKTSGAPEVTADAVRRAATDPKRVEPTLASVIERVAADYRFFHWPLEFPAVFARGGFDVVLGNPPWERVKLQEKEFFAERSPAVANARNAAERKRMIADLQRTDPSLWQAFQDALRRSDGESRILSGSGRYPLAGRGDINTYPVFAELMRSITGPGGRQGVILPTGIATDDTTKFFFGDVVSKRVLVSLFSFENEEFVFPAIHHATKFCLLTLAGSDQREPADLVFFARQVTDLADSDRHFSLGSDDFRLLSPLTGTCPTFRSARDAALAEAIYRRVPVLGDGHSSGGWRVGFHARLFHMAEDSHHFFNAPSPESVPLYESKMVHQFDDRFGTYARQTQAQRNQGILPRPTDEEKLDPSFTPVPRYWVSADELHRRLQTRWSSDWLLVWRKITSAVTSRTVIASIIPLSGFGDSGYVCFPDGPLGPMMIGNLNSFVVDWLARQRIGGNNLSLHVVQQLPLLPPSAYHERCPWAGERVGEWVRRYVGELVTTSSALSGFGTALGWSGPPFTWDPLRRRRLRAELDAAFFHLYGLGRSDVEHILDSFWIVRERDEKEWGTYRTKDLILEAFDAMSVATPEAPFAPRLDPPPGDPLVAHAPGGHWLPWDELEIGVAGRQRGFVAVSSPQRADSTVETEHAGDQSPLRRAAERGQATTTHQQTVSGQLAIGQQVGADWRTESQVEPAEIMLGMRVRHRTKGLGTVLTVKRDRRSTELLIAFDSSGEAWIAFGYGVLEFAHDTGGRDDSA